MLGKSGAEIEAAARDLMTQKYSIHFHCWDKSALRGFLESARGYFGNIFSIVDFRPNGPETVMVIKHRDVTAWRNSRRMPGSRRS